MGVPPVSPNEGWKSANGFSGKNRLQALDRRGWLESRTQVRRLWYLRLGEVRAPEAERKVS